MPILCTLLVIFRGWTLVDALSFIVHLYQQFGKEINQDLQLFLWDSCGNVSWNCFSFFG